MVRNLRQSFVLLLLGVFCSAGLAISFPAAAQSGAPTLIFTKVLKGSVPEYVRITVNAEGQGTYDGRKISQAPEARPMRVSPQVTSELFLLAHKLDDFRVNHLASHKRVADLGLKTLEYQANGVTFKAEYNYTENRDGRRLTDLFEGISAVEQHIQSLEFSARYDPLGLPHELTLIEIDLRDNALVDPQLMTPILDQISKNNSYMHIAQERARNILERISRN